VFRQFKAIDQMSDSDAEEPMPFTFIGPLPPPVTGMTAMSRAIVEEVEKLGPIDCYNWSRQKHLKGIRWKMARAWGVLRSCVSLLAKGLRTGEILYYPANSSWGMIYDVFILGLARILGYRIVLHHHAYTYFDCYDWRMALVNRIVGPRGAHVVHCEKMKRDFLAHYPTEARFLFVPPTIVSLGDPIGSPRPFPVTRKFTLGFLSNLTFAKGLLDVLETFERLRAAGYDVRLILAGPCQVDNIQTMVDNLLTKWGDGVEYRGPVYGEEKKKFYQDIDVFIFPTKTESWGIVLTEALSAGCPVIVNDRGCVSYVIQGGCGVVVPRGEDFVATAIDRVRRWMENPSSYEEMSVQAVQRIKELNTEAAEQLPEFVRRVRGLAEGQAG